MCFGNMCPWFDSKIPEMQFINGTTRNLYGKYKFMAKKKKKILVDDNAFRNAPATMLIRNDIPAEEFLKAYGKYNHAKSPRR